MNRYEQRLAAFYAAFRELDAASMRAAYAPAARFQDPVFRLAGRDEIGAMWAMLAEATARQGRDVWRLDFSDITADASHGRARWEARYRFSSTGRMVHNIIEASFSFDASGLIGSKTKRARFIHRFEAMGIPMQRIARMTCPIGIEGIAAKEPEIIAVSVVAQLLQE
jgi:xanthine/CO dehydrogenase XdhC/CoxF family maturation factor